MQKHTFFLTRTCVVVQLLLGLENACYALYAVYKQKVSKELANGNAYYRNKEIGAHEAENDGYGGAE